MYTLTILGRKYHIGLIQGFILVLVVLAIAITLLTLSLTGWYRAYGAWAAWGVAIISTAITINETEYAIITNKKVRKVVSYALMFTGLYFWLTV